MALVLPGSASASMTFPRKVSVFLLNSHFDGLRVAPAASIRLRTASTLS